MKRRPTTPPAPSDAQLLREYLDPRNPTSFARMAEKYKWTQASMLNHIKAQAELEGRDWPLRPKAVLERKDSVSAQLAAKTLNELRDEYSISMATIARHLDLDASGLYGIASGRRPRIRFAMQAKILNFAVMLDAGELELPREPAWRAGQPVCRNDHPYTGARDSRGTRQCLMCRAEKQRRAEARRLERLRATEEAVEEPSEAV